VPSWNFIQPLEVPENKSTVGTEIEISVKLFDSLGQFVSILTGQTLILQMLGDVANA
jgi:hypothetical protein